MFREIRRSSTTRPTLAKLLQGDSHMAYSNFTLDTAVEAFDLEEMNAAGIFTASEPVEPSELLTSGTPCPVWNPDIRQPIKETPQQKPHPYQGEKEGMGVNTQIPPCLRGVRGVNTSNPPYQGGKYKVSRATQGE